jgi:Emfourin
MFMIIKVERSGGLTGIPMTKEVDANDLPPTLVTTAKKIMENAKTYSLPLSTRPKGAADQFTYRILIRDGIKKSVIECNEYNIQDELRLLVRYIERNPGQ